MKKSYATFLFLGGDAQLLPSRRGAWNIGLTHLSSIGSCFGTLLLLLLFGMSAHCSAQAMNGHWVNVDPQSQGVAKIDIQGTQVCWRGCERGTVATTPAGPVLRVEFKPASATRSVELSMAPDGRLSVRVHTHYTDASKRSDHDTVDILKRAPAQAADSRQSVSPQPPPPPDNVADAGIFKLIRAGLPEQVVLIKIREGSGHWDTSVDALIALKQSGATDAELAAMTVAPVAPVVMPQPTVTRPALAVPVLGGTLTNKDGEVAIFMPGSAPDDRSNMLFHLVTVNGHVALKLTVWADVLKTLNYLCYSTYGDLVIERDQVTYYPYGKSKWGALGGYSYTVALMEDLTPAVYRMSDIHPEHTHIPGHTALVKGTPYTFDWDGAFDKKAKAMASQEFLQSVFRDFDGTIAKLVQAAGLTNPDAQLNAASHFKAASREEANAIVVAHNQEIAALKARAQEQAKNNPKPSGGGMSSFLNTMQGVANMTQAMSEGNAASAAHDTMGQLNAAVALTKAEVDTIGSVGNPDAPIIQPLAPASSTQTQPPAAQMRPNAVAAPKKATGFTYNVSHGQPASSSTASNNIASSAQPKASPNPGGKPSGVSTGTAAPANCVYLSPSQPCVPLAQYQQMQAQQQSSTQGICPASGFVPGVMRRTSNDTSEGVPCTPGQPIDPSLLASSGTSGRSGSGSGGTDTGGPFDPDLKDCITPTYKNDPITGDHLILKNNCDEAAHVFFYASPQIYGGVHLKPGESDNTYQSHDKIVAAGGISIYACPEGDIPRQADGTLAFNGNNNSFRCSRK
jgi:hypothetical protein